MRYSVVEPFKRERATTSGVSCYSDDNEYCGERRQQRNLRARKHGRCNKHEKSKQERDARHPGGSANYGLLPARPGALRESTDLPHLWPEQKIMHNCEEKECADQS